MAHSYIFAKNSIEEREVCVTDSRLRMFMYFFNEVANGMKELSNDEIGICEHYDLELIEWHTSYINLMLDEIYNNSQLRLWYFSVLDNMVSLLSTYGDFIDNEYLNKLTKLNSKFDEPYPTSLLKNLINYVFWVLNKEGISPSDDLRWYVNPL